MIKVVRPHCPDHAHHCNVNYNVIDIEEIPDKIFPSSFFGGEKETETDSTGNEVIRYRFSLLRYYQD